MSRTSKFLKKWERIRARGAVSFVLLYGVFAFGGLFGLLFPVVFAAVMGRFDLLGQMYATVLPLSAFGGAVWGAFMWLSLDRKYLLYMAQSRNEPPRDEVD